MHRRILSDSEIEKARNLRAKGYSNRQLAEIFEVGKTTLWQHVYAKRPRPRRMRAHWYPGNRYHKINLVIRAVNLMRQQGLNSLEVSQNFNIPIKEVNFIYSHLHGQ